MHNQAMESAIQIKHYKDLGVPAGLEKCKASRRYRLPENWIKRCHEEAKGPEGKRGAQSVPGRGKRLIQKSQRLQWGWLMPSGEGQKVPLSL